MSRLVLLALAVPSLVACSGTTPAPNARLAVAVAALELPGVADACYSLAVTNEAGEPVWAQAGICASRYGAGADISYVAPCDATDGDGLDGARNTITLTIDDLFDADGAPLSDFVDPCAAPHNPGGCRLTTACRENADTPVTFDLTLMRRANQGFFDVAVTFEDIFCSAKADCVDGSGPLTLVHDPETQARVESVVLAFACADGSADGPATHLYREPIEIVCGADRYQVDPSAGPGNIYPGGVGAPAPLVQAMVFEGAEAVVNQATGAPADKLYWNVALGLDTAWFAAQPAGTTCRLVTRMTASEGPLAAGQLPATGFHPYLEVDLPLWTTGPAAARQCTRHPLDGAPAGVGSAFSAPTLPAVGFSYAGAMAGGAMTTIALVSLVDECQAEPAPCDPHATCTDLEVGFACACTAGYEGDGLTCTDIDGCASDPCFTGVTCSDQAAPLTGFTCGSCPTGYEGDGVTCTLTECGAADCCLDPSLCLETLGDGSDGALVLSAAFDAQASGSNGRTQPDMVAHLVTGLSGAVVTADATTGIAAGDAVLLINLSSSTGDTSAVGNYEARWVEATTATTLTLDLAPTATLAPGGDLTGQQVWVQRIPQYTNVTIQSGGSLGVKTTRNGGTGVLAFRATGTVHVQTGGNINLTGRGWEGNRPASNGVHGGTGESLAPQRAGSTDPGLPNFGGGGGGKSNCNTFNCTTQLIGAAGGGGSFGGAGTAGANNGTQHVGGSPGNTYGDACHSKLFLGSGGGGGAGGVSGPGTVYTGGDGGGILHIVANAFVLDGYVYNDGITGSYNNNCGTQGSGGGGAGSGGATVIHAATMTIASDRLFARGGAAVCNGGGVGGAGRIKLAFTTLNGVAPASASAQLAAVATPDATCPETFPAP